MEINKCELADQAKQTGAELLNVLAGFTEEQFNTTPLQGGWTAGQVTEHLLLSAGAVEVIAGRTEPPQREPDAHLATLAGAFLDFSTKMSSPDFVLPSGGYHDKEELLNKIKIVWDKMGEGIRLLDLSALCLDFEMPNLGMLTRLEWLWFYVYHSQRHLRQLKNIHATLVSPTPA